MDAGRFRRVRQVFEEALDLEEDCRAAFIAEVTAGDPELRSAVEAMLAQSDGGETLEGSVAQYLDDADHVGIDPGDPTGTVVGPYRLVRRIGRGGMGTVYEAQQSAPSRAVALKMLPWGLVGENAMRRFRYEAEIMGHLSHPGIAQIYEVGTWSPPGSDPTHSVPYFAMELVPQAKDLLSWVRGRDLGLTERLQLFLEVCEAVQHGHQKGVVHCDLKPSNVLVGKDGRVKVIDFGIARARELDLEKHVALTREGEVLGTLQTMSPEQAAGDRAAVDTRSDVYSLGVILHQLLSGGTPYDLEGIPWMKAAFVILETPPCRPSTIDPSIPEDLDWIVLRALEKKPANRYPSAAELALDVRRFLRMEPVLAGPPSTAYRMAKFVRRHRVATTSAAIVVLSLVIAVVGTTWGMREALAKEAEAEDARRGEAEKARLAEEKRELAERQALRAETVRDFVVNLFESPVPTRFGRQARVVEYLDPAAADIGTRFANDPEVEADMRHVVGIMYRSLGLTAPAEEHLRRSLELRRTLLEASAPDLLTSQLSLARLCLDQGGLEEAQELARKTVEVFAAAEDEGAEGCIDAREILGLCASLSGNCEEGIEVLRQAMKERAEIYGVRSEETLSSLLNLGSALSRCGRRDEAVVILQKLLAEGSEVLHPEHEMLLFARANLATTLASQRTPEALAQGAQLTEMNHEICRERFGERDSRTLQARVNFLGMIIDLGRLDEAAQLDEGLVERCREAFGDSGEFTLTAMNNRAGLLVRLGRREAALEIMESVLAGRLASVGEHSSKTWNDRMNLAANLLGLGRLGEAVQQIQTTLDSARTVLPAGHPQLRAIAESLERALRRADRKAEADRIRAEHLTVPEANKH